MHLATELDRYREKLLDLSNRNPLLSYKKTSRTIQIVDELPDQIFNRIVEQKGQFRFQAADEDGPRTTGSGSRTIKPRQEQLAITAAATESDISSTTPDSTLETDPTPSIGTASINRRVRHSRRYSIELPIPTNSSVSKHHVDDLLQTNIIDQEKLESQLKSIAQRANSAIEGTGVNYLHLVLGTLLWTEADSSERTFTAPLILIPVQLERVFDQRSARYTYKLNWTEEDVQHNLSLERKLERDFALKLPRLEEDQSPEEYFVAVRTALTARPGWQVCREAFIGFFSFHKLLMYLDADPKNWADKLENELSPATCIMCGSDQVDAGTALYASEYLIDEDKTAGRIPLIVDADSSQHSALCDILKGKSLVIEGPPGTGKSQTITNAIGAILHQGKSVLFVAEKLAALEVVQNKLTDAGLGEFCLAIHSDNASPRLVFESLRRRMDGKFPAPRAIELERSQLEENKKRLNEYLKFQQASIGPLGETLHELQWRVIADCDADIPGLPDPTMIPEPTATNFDANCIELRTFQAMLAELHGPKQSPWWGFVADKVPPNEQEVTLETLRELQRTGSRVAEVLQNCIRNLGGTADFWFSRAVPQFKQDHQRLEAAANSAKQLDGWEYLSTAEQREVAQRLIRAFRSYHTLKDEVAELSFDSNGLPAIEAARVEEVIQKELAASCGNCSLKQIRSLRVWLEELVPATRAVCECSRLLESLNCGPARTPAEYHQVYEFLRLGLHPVVATSKQFSRNLYGRGSVDAYVAARKKADELAADQAMLDHSFYKESIPDATAILELEKRLRPFARSWLPWLSADFRRARQQLFQFARPTIGKDVAQWLRALETLREFERRRDQFRSSKEFEDLFGNRFKGLDTDWEDLKLFITWVHNARDRGLSYEQSLSLLATASTVGQQRERIRGSIRRLSAELQLTAQLESIGLQSQFVETTRFEDMEARAQHLANAIRAFENTILNLRVTETQTLAELLKQLRMVRSFESARRELNSPQMWQALGPWFRGIDTNAADLQTALDLLEGLRAVEIPGGLDQALANFSPLGLAQLVGDAYQRLIADRTTWQQLRQALGQRGQLDESWLNLELSLATDPGCQQKLGQVLAASNDFPRWCTFSRALAACTRSGLGRFLDRAMDGDLPNDKIAAAYRRAVYENAISRFMLTNPPLREFSRQKHEEIRRSFQQIDRHVIELNRQQIACDVARRQPPAGSSRGRVAEYTEMGLIRHEIQKQQRFCRIRDLLQRAGQSVQTLKPCFMMSPLSVAQYLPPHGLEFDLVIMDEASQIKPEDAMGTILRARQLIIVGDPKQMPPTSFFDRQDDEVDDEEATQMDNTESILEVASKTFQPIRRLRWHYRSRHEHLIQFSNERFYDHDLIVFPSPGTERGRLGVFLHKIEDGFFENRQNASEARKVVEAILQHAINHPNESLGVGTLNMNQARLISDLLDKACENDPVGRAALENLDQLHGQEKLFIKNLENLQGDERDVIFISFTYGKDSQSGRVFNRFGPMTSAVGWRRFNVLITRARKRLEVFSSMQPLDIQGGPNKSRGVNAMRDFLEFCQTRIVPDRKVDSGRSPDSDFEISVGQVISDLGMRYVPQVGVAGFFIDIGVLHPDADSDFILGIECDGASYHSAKSARDRDRLRQEIIESRGWKIHRIWSTDWFQNQEFEIERLRQTLTTCLKM